MRVSDRFLGFQRIPTSNNMTVIIMVHVAVHVCVNYGFLDFLKCEFTGRNTNTKVVCISDYCQGFRHNLTSKNYEDVHNRD